MKYCFTKFLFLLWVVSPLTPLHAERLAAVDADAGGETANAADDTDDPTKENKEEEDQAKRDNPASAGLAALTKKLSKPNGSPALIGLLTPIDYTTMNYTELAEEQVIGAISRYGNLPITKINDEMSRLTLQEFRRLVTKNQVDVLLVIILKPTNFDIFLYDKRTPYDVYAYSETLPEKIQYKVSPEAVEEFTKVLVRRIFYAYLQNQSYSLPREESQPLLNAEVPRWLASTRSFQTLNKELLSTFYGSISVGAALLVGNESRTWSSNLIEFEAGFKVSKNIWLSGAINMFSYNAVVASAKYMLTDQDNPAKFLIGFGLAQTLDAKTINWDQNLTQGVGMQYAVPSFTLLFPIVDLYLKLETQAFVGLGGGKFIFAVTPGIFMLF